MLEVLLVSLLVNSGESKVDNVNGQTPETSSLRPAGPRGRNCMKNVLLLLSLLCALTVAVPARAQGGCDDSPENPTLVLAGLAGGAYAISAVRTRLRARRTLKDR
jgi:XrtJ-associated TM-motif-TM protein